MHFRLKSLVEVDQHVTAEDHVEFAERAIGHEVVLREDHVLRKRLVEERSTVLRRVVLGERPLAAGADVVVGVFLHPLERKDSGLRSLQHHFVDVGGVDA